MQASFLVNSLLPASPGGSSAGTNASQGAASIGNFASAQARAGSDTQPSFSSLLDRAAQGEPVMPNRAAAASSARPSGPQEARTATNVPKETKVEVGEETERHDAASAAPEEGGDEKTLEDPASGQHGVAPEVAQLLNQLMTGTARAPTDRTTAPLQPSQAAKGQAEVLGAATKTTPKDLAKTSEPSTGDALSAAAALRKSMSRPNEADPAMATDSTKAPAASPPGESLRVEPPSTSKAVEPRPQSSQTALPQIVGNALAPGAGVAGFLPAMNTSTGPTAAESAIPHGIHQAEFVPPLYRVHTRIWGAHCHNGARRCGTGSPAPQPGGDGACGAEVVVGRTAGPGGHDSRAGRHAAGVGAIHAGSGGRAA